VIYDLSVKIKIEQSGGFAGISSCTDMNADRLPPSLEDAVKDLLNSAKLPQPKGLESPKGAADYLNYKISINDGKEDYIIECNEYEMNTRTKALVRYVQENSKKQ
jgi:hypothetical protein